MATYIPHEIDFSTFPESDGAPMAETADHMHQMYGLIFAAHHFLEVRGVRDHAAGGNQFLYYNPLDGREHCSPDVYIALGVPPGNRAKWETWVEGKCPDIVMEITSPSTAREDRRDKVTLYDRLGAREYYIYDPQQATTPVLVAYWRRGARLEQMTLLENGGIVSPLMGAELRPVGQFLRIIDPDTDAPIPVPEELWATMREEIRVRQEAEEARRAAEARARAADARIALLEAALREASARASKEDSGSDPLRLADA